MCYAIKVLTQTRKNSITYGLEMQNRQTVTAFAVMGIYRYSLNTIIHN